MNITNELQTQNVLDGEMYRRIGQGFCGTVWASATEPGPTRAYKREDVGLGRSLHNDYIMHKRALESLPLDKSRVAVPACHHFVSNNDQTSWDKHIQRFPKGFQIPCNILISDRIPPFPQQVRDTITDRYCPEPLRPLIKQSEPDQDCLIRPYLGRRRRLEKQSRFQAFSLRNYPLHLDQIEDLGLDSALYAKIMAETLADLYWRAHIDANDLEFVLAPASIQSGEESTYPTVIRSDVLGDHVMWILDFDCCKEMSMDRIGVEQAARAFHRNDPFYPRPGCEDTKDEVLWNVFKDCFVEASEAILGQESPDAHLPALWVHLVEQGGQLEDR